MRSGYVHPKVGVRFPAMTGTYSSGSCGPLAQLVEQGAFNPRVVGSSPTWITGRKSKSLGGVTPTQTPGTARSAGSTVTEVVALQPRTWLPPGWSVCHPWSG